MQEHALTKQADIAGGHALSLLEPGVDNGCEPRSCVGGCRGD